MGHIDGVREQPDVDDCSEQKLRNTDPQEDVGYWPDGDHQEPIRDELR